MTSSVPSTIKYTARPGGHEGRKGSMMYFEKRYQGTERDENGKLISTFSYSTPEEFDQYISQYPPMTGHVLTLFDSCTALDCFGLVHKIVREVAGG